MAAYMRPETDGQQRGSGYLKELAAFLRRYRYVLVYGAGGVTKALLPLLEEITEKDRIRIVVSEKTDDGELLEGYPVRGIDAFTDARDESYVILSVMPGSVAAVAEKLAQLGFPHHCTAGRIIDALYGEIWADTPVSADRILFSNFGGGGFGGNPKYIALELMRRRKGLDLVWAVQDESHQMPEGIRCVKKGTYEYYRELAAARVWIDNQHKDLHTRKREGQTYIQTWHGCGPLKKIEFDAPGLPASYLELCERNAGMEDLAVSPTRFNTEQYRRAFHYRGEILECGYPRNDLFFKDNGCRRRLGSLFGVSEEEGLVLYAPTFREGGEKAVRRPDPAGVCRALEERFGRRYRMLLRLHPSEAGTGRDAAGEGVVDVTAYDDAQELLAAADVLITDYSSIMWDFSLQKKPVFLFHPDADAYERERGYYLPFGSMPYIEASDDAQLRERILSFDAAAYEGALSKFLDDYGSFDRGTASQAVAERVLAILDGKT